MIKLVYKAQRAIIHVGMHAAVQAAMLLAFGIPAHAAQSAGHAPANATAQGNGVVPTGPAILSPAPPK
ncbi:MAG: hypothetical protein EOP92_40335 [Lysobacteraceae bacterium]|nr:MAG: hypothetical protein EOP92_40335 [Xanthomonadaceae bacterium]